MNNNYTEPTNGGSNNECNVDVDLYGAGTQLETSSKSSQTGSCNYIGELKLDEHGKVTEAGQASKIPLSDKPEQDQEMIVGFSPLIFKLVDKEAKDRSDDGRD